jgi:hypothetical protein
MHQNLSKHVYHHVSSKKQGVTHIQCRKKSTQTSNAKVTKTTARVLPGYLALVILSPKNPPKID